MHILVVGGAGYIGSHMVKLLNQRGFEVTVLDNLCNGHRDAVQGARFVLGDLYEREILDQLFEEIRFDGVMHFASYIQVGESVREPAKYYRNNVFKTQNLLDAMIAHRVGHFIFSSTAAIFGEPIRIPIDETHPKQPINPTGAANGWSSRCWRITTRPMA
jgi:UDP-glucose 4-epimerase